MRRALMLLAALAGLSPLLFVPVPDVSAQIGSGTAELEWIAPTTRVDGTPVGIITDYRVYRQRDDSGIWMLEASLPGTVLVYIDDGLFNGEYCYQVTAGDAFGNESAPSNTQCKTITAGGVAAPNPPILTVR